MPRDAILSREPVPRRSPLVARSWHLPARSIFRTVPPRLTPPVRAAAVAWVTWLVGACADTPSTPPPRAEFLVSAGDSTYWVRPVGERLRLRGSPLLLARFDGRFHEVYVTDDDRSYEDAVFVGQRLWRRDLVRGDSVLVFEDTLVPRLARRWAAEHPDARLLEPTEPEAEDPLAAVTADLAVIAVHGPYLSYEYHADIEDETREPWHTTRRGVVDLRSGRRVTLADLFGRALAERTIAAGRRRYRATIDSLASSGDERAARIAGSLEGFTFDPMSFSLEGDASSAAVAFFVPGSGEGESGDVAVPVAPIDVPAAPWWGDLRPTLPAIHEREPVAEWEQGRYRVTARYRNDRALLTLHASDDARWEIGAVQAPVHHILWLDAPVVDSVTRRGLMRAFDEALFYDEMMRTARYEAPVAGRTSCRQERPAARPRA